MARLTKTLKKTQIEAVHGNHQKEYLDALQLDAYGNMAGQLRLYTKLKWFELL